MDEELAANPPIVQGEVQIDGKPHPVFRSQPIPHKFTWDASPFDAEIMQFTIADLGQGNVARFTASHSL